MSSQNQNPIKSEKEIKAEVLGLLGTLKEKLEFVKKCSDKYLLSIYNSLYKDPNFKDGSEVCEYQIYQLMLKREHCPKEIVLGCLGMPWFEGQDLVFRSPHIDSSIIDKVCLANINEVKKNWSLKQSHHDILVSVLHSPNLNNKTRTKLENFIDKLSEKFIDDSLVSVAVKFTKREKWLAQKFSNYLKGGSGDMSFINNVIENPLAKPFMVDYACRLCFNPEVANTLVRHPKISIQGLENLRSKFNNMANYIDKMIEHQLDPED